MTLKDTPLNDNNAELSTLRRQIDEFDDRIIALLIERTSIVSRVGELKRRTAPGLCPIRPGREATMIRRIIERFSGSDFLPAAAAAIWRIIIGMSTSVESSLKLAVFTPERDNELYWMAREYFGPFAPVIREPHIKRVIGDVMDGKAAVGIVPMLKSGDTTYWWTNLMEQSPDTPKIFARIPFVTGDVPGRDAPSALAIARIAPEESGDDRSILVLEADHNASQNRLQSALQAARIEAQWMNIATLSPQIRHHLIEVKGFVTPAMAQVKALQQSLGNALIKVSFLGAYAVPMSVAAKETVPETKPAALHVPAQTTA